MSEKAVLTKEQTEELELQIKELPRTSIVYRRINSLNNNKAFSSICLDTLIKALYIGYETKETYDIDDYVIDTEGNVLEVEKELLNDRYKLKYINSGLFQSKETHESNIVRNATEQEVWWAKHNKEVWELNENDVLRSPYNNIMDVVDDDGYTVAFTNGHVTSKSYVKAYFKIVCFAENRKDI